MLGQLNIFGKTKLEATLERIKTFEPKDGYYLAFSGGKDSQCIYHLCKMAGVKFDAHYRVTSVDPPELVQFIKEYYPDVSREIPRDKEGNAITMWNLIPKRRLPPTRIARYCCSTLKESGGTGRCTMTGVRWSESVNRSKNQGGVTIMSRSKKLRDTLQEEEIDYRETDRSGVVLNLDNDQARRGVEICYRTHKTLVNPIIDWDESDVWEFLNDVAKVPHCRLYDEGFKRLGCIGCPMGGGKGQMKAFERWPTYKRAYIRAFEKMLHSSDKGYDNWKNGDEVMEWWLDPGGKKEGER